MDIFDGFMMLKNAMSEHFQEMIADSPMLFEMDADKDALWNLYLANVPERGKTFRKREIHDCSACRQFIRTLGNTAVIRDGKLESIWHFDPGTEAYRPVVKVLDEYLNQFPIRGIFVRKDSPKVGVNQNLELLEDGTVITWPHLYVRLPDRLVDRSDRSEDAIRAEYLTRKHLLQRSLAEITDSAIEQTLELIASNSLYRGGQWENTLRKLGQLKKQYASAEEKELFLWERAADAGAAVCGLRNDLIGSTLLVDLSNGVGLQQAVSRYTLLASGDNYQRSRKGYNELELLNAQKDAEEKGYLQALPRRFATLDDMDICNLLWVNRGLSRKPEAGDVFETLKASAVSRPRNFSRIPEIGIREFLENTLPRVKFLEVYAEDRLADNLVSLTAAQNPDAPVLFKWDNHFSWTYRGGFVDELRTNVRKAGGNTEGIVRFSIQWNDDRDSYDGNDLDAHCIFVGSRYANRHIYYGNKADPLTSGALDVDIVIPKRDVSAVENIVFTEQASLLPGEYTFYVKCFDWHGGKPGGFRAVLHCAGTVMEFTHKKPMYRGDTVVVAKVIYDGKGHFTIREEELKNDASHKDCAGWGLRPNAFTPVTAVMLSPNCWGGQTVGEKRYFFMLKDCVNRENPSAFLEENLKYDLREHGRVLRDAAKELILKTVPDQLSGFGFAESLRGDMVVRVTDDTRSRVLRIRF